VWGKKGFVFFSNEMGDFTKNLRRAKSGGGETRMTAKIGERESQ
jgi:hypothetical protein